jgi:DNA-binding transcriptional MerR regulator
MTMRISQLSERAGLPIGTVKFYLRTGLLPAGRQINATQADYSDGHLERLRLIRALIEVGRLSVAEIQSVLKAIDGSMPVGEGLAMVHQVTSLKGREPSDIEVASAHELVSSLGWTIEPDSPHLTGLARAIAALDSIGLPPSPARLKVYAEAASHVARNDVDWILDGPDERQVEMAVVSAVLWEALLSSLRRLASENQVVRRRTGVPSPRSTVPSA